MNNLRKYRKELLLKFSLVTYGIFLGMLSGISASVSFNAWLIGVILCFIVTLAFWISYNRYDIGGLDG